MNVNILALCRVQGTAKYVIVGMREVKIKDPKYTINVVNDFQYGYSEYTLFRFNRRFGCGENLHLLERSIAGKRTFDNYAGAERDAVNLIAETIKLCTDIMRRYELERKDVYFNWILLKGSKEEEFEGGYAK